MALPRLLLATLLTALAIALVAPAATAHTAVYSADNRVRASIGLLAEPVSTYALTGLDVCFTATRPRRARPPPASTPATSRPP
jgi:hypothetical protein